MGPMAMRIGFDRLLVDLPRSTCPDLPAHVYLPRSVCVGFAGATPRPGGTLGWPMGWSIARKSLVGSLVVFTTNRGCHDVRKERVAAAKICLENHDRCEDLKLGRVGPVFSWACRRAARPVRGQRGRQTASLCAIGAIAGLGHPPALSHPVAIQVRGAAAADRSTGGVRQSERTDRW